MILLVGIVPLYLVIADRTKAGVVHAPAIPLDQLFPLSPPWALIYGALYAFLIVLPVLVVQQRDLVRRTVWTYLTVWLLSYLIFLLYPSVAPRPERVAGSGFAVSGLRFLYQADPPYNCFPSIHVAHSFVSALACWRVHRTLGVVTLACATLVGLSTLFTRQHYVVDVIAGFVLALVAGAVFLRGYSRDRTPTADAEVAPSLALLAGGIVAVGVTLFWVSYRSGFLP